MTNLTTWLSGYNEGFARALALVQARALEAARRGAPQQATDGDAEREAAEPPLAPSQWSAPPTNSTVPPVRRAKRGRRKLTPSEEYALLAITENPGLSFDELKAQCGLRSAGPIYNLIRKRKVRRVEDPKPWSAHGPHVRFYPVNQSWSDISA